jgi:hypothetical protein
MHTESLRKCGLALILAVLSSGVGKGIAQTVPIPPSQLSLDGSNLDNLPLPNPNCIPGVTCLAIH